MKIESASERLQSGEVNSRMLTVITDGEADGKTVRLGFITPMGRVYISGELDVSSGKTEYLIPEGVLDGKGILFAQILITSEDGYALKSRVFEFPVFASVDDYSIPSVSDTALYSLSTLKELIDEKSDVGHSHDEEYYTKGVADSLLAMKSDIRHDHSGTYLTASEILRLVAGMTASEHDHDGRYYTESEITALLATKSDTSHGHSYESLSGKPTINGKDLTVNTDINGLMFRRILTEADDCNSIKDDGVYVYSTASAPANAPFPNASVIAVFGNPENRTQKIQIGFRYGTTGFFAFRPLYDGNYLEWTKATDFVTEAGTSGEWSYRKWSSGKMEAWGVVTLTVTKKGAVSEISGMSALTAECKFPSGMLADTSSKPIECCQLLAKDYRFIGSMTSVSSNNLWGRFYTYNSFADSFTVDSSTLKASAYLAGRWKT